MNTKLERLEKKLNIASDLIKEFEVDDLVVLPEPTVMNMVEVKEDIQEVFEMNNLKSDFMLIRNNVLKLISTGQRVLESVSIIDPCDMKASQIQAIAGMHETLGNNLKLLIDLYKQIVDIETIKNKKGKLAETTNQTISTGNNITNNQILFTGSSDELLKLIKENK